MSQLNRYIRNSFSSRFERFLPAFKQFSSTRTISSQPLLYSLLVFFFLGCFSTASHAEKQAVLKPIKVQLSWNHQFQFAGFYAAKKQGYYREAGLDVSINAWKPGVDAMADVISGQTDYATGYGAIVADFAKGKPISLLMASFQYSPMILLSRRPLQGLSDLAGKTVMHYGNLQVRSLIDKANAINEQPVKEVNSSGNLQDFIDGKIDFYSAYQTNEPFRLRQQNIAFHVVDPKTYGVQSYGDVIYTSQNKADSAAFEVADFKEATIKGWRYALKHPEEVVDYLIENYPVQKSREALLAEANSTIQFVDTGLVPVGHVDYTKLMVTAVQAKETGLMTQTELDGFKPEAFLFKAVPIQLTAEERQYLEQHPVLKVGNDFNWPPFDFINEEGQYDGIIADYIKWIAKTLHLELQTLKETHWEQILVDLKHGKLDVAPGAMDTPGRREYLDFTNPYMKFPLVLMAREDVGFVSNLNQLSGERIAVPRGWYTEELLKTSYPEIELVLVDEITEGLDSVIHGKAEFYLGNLAAINYQIKSRNLTGLKAVGTVYDSEFLLTMAVTKGNDTLRSILQKTLDAMPQDEHKRIYDRWIKLEVVHETNYGQLIRWVSASLFIILILSLAVLWLHKQRRQQRSYIEQVNDLSMATYTNLKTREIEWISDSFVELIGCSKEQLINKSHNALKHPEVPDDFYEEIYKTLARGEVWQGEIRGKAKCGREFWVDATVTPDIKKGKVVGAWTTRVDITDKKRLEELAIRDVLTGVYNRNQFNELFDAQVHKAGRQNETFAMAMFDVDDFKKINDRFGHQRGDEVLIAVMDIAKRYFCRANDLIFRVGGEEFVILSDFENIDEFQRYLEKFREAVEALRIPNPDSRLQVLTISVGALYCKQMSSYIHSSQLYTHVDKMLYQAKSNGRNQVVMDFYKEVCGE